MFFAFGVNHNILKTGNRAVYMMDPERQIMFYKNACASDISSVIILNTCNRTEIYGIGSVARARELYLRVMGLDQHYESALFSKNGPDAFYHVYRVACGLDSQVIGDLEVLGQFKNAVRLSKRHRMLSGYLERLANSVMQAAKEVRHTTNISSGTASLAYALARYINAHTDSDNTYRVLLLGTGEFGRNIMRYLRDYCPNTLLSLCNRTRHKAEQLIRESNARIYDFHDLHQAISDNDIVISSVSNSSAYIVDHTHIRNIVSGKLFINMSVPYSINPSLAESPFCTIENLDTISKIVEGDIEARKRDIPAAMRIVQKHLDEFIEWTSIFERSETIRHWKHMMIAMSDSCPHLSPLPEEEKERLLTKNLAEFVEYLKQNKDLPNDTRIIIEHFITQTKKAIHCRDVIDCPHSFNPELCTQEACHQS